MIDFYLHGYGEFDAARRIGPAVWAHFDLLFIHDGRVSMRLAAGDDEIELADGQCVLIFPNTPFQGHSLTTRTRVSVQHFGLGRRSGGNPVFRRLAGCREGYSVHGHLAGRAVEDDVHRAMKLAAADDGSPVARAARIANLTLILAALGDPPAPSGHNAAEDVFQIVIRWAQQNLRRGPTVQDLARRAGLSCSHFRTRFARSCGRSAGALLMDLRLREAARLLRETQMPVKQIARQTGYSDVANFHRAFVRRHSLTPALYRQRHAPAG